MAFPLGALVPGLTRALTSYQSGKFQGQQQARTDALAEQDRQRQARQDLLAQQLIQAQLGNYQSLAQERQQATAATQTQQRAVTDAARRLRALPNLDPRLAALPDADLVGAMKTQATQPPRNLDPWGPEAIAARQRLAATTADRSYTPAMGEREKASAAVLADQANQSVNQLETQFPDIGARVARKAAMRRTVLSGIGKRLTGMSDEQMSLQLESSIEQSMSPEELAYYTAQKQLMSAVIPGLSGKTVTAREYSMQAPAYFSMGATSPAVTEARRRFREDRIGRLYAEAGRAAPPRTPTAPVAPVAPPAPQQRVGGRSMSAGVANPQRFFQP